MFYEHTRDRFEALARQVRRERQPPPEAPCGPSPPGRRPSRNAPCPCGSARKFKHCCGAAGNT